MAIGLDLKQAQDIAKEILVLEEALREEYERRIDQQTAFIVNKVHDYLDYELGKLLASFPERQAEIAAWKAKNPPQQIVDEEVCLKIQEEMDDEAYICELEDHIEMMQEQIDCLEIENAELMKQLGQKGVFLKNSISNQVNIE